MMLVTPPPAVVSLLEPWASFYGDSRLTQTVVTFAHVGGLLVAGGIAVATDRVTLRLASDVDRRRHLIEVSYIHRTVIIALGVVIFSGVLQVAADIEAIWSSWIYWTKMVLVVLLLANGWRMRRIEMAAEGDAVVSAGNWAALRGATKASLVLWLVTTLAGVALINYA